MGDPKIFGTTAPPPPITVQHTRLNTRGFCFLCLNVIAESDNVPPPPSWVYLGKPLVSLKILQRCFGIGVNEGPPGIAGASKSKIQQEFDVELCDYCIMILGRFKNAFLSLEKAQMELNHWAGHVHQLISEDSKRPQVAHRYLERMRTSKYYDQGETLFVDELRNEIAEKCLTMKAGSEPLIILHPTKWKPRSKSSRAPESENLGEDNANQAESESNFIDENVNEEIELSTVSTSPASSPAIIKVEDEDEEQQHKNEIIIKTNSSSSLLPSPSHSKTKMYIRDHSTGSFHCSSCNKQFASPRNARNHYETTHLGKKYPCDICKMTFNHRTSLMRHKKTYCKGIKKRRNYSQRQQQPSSSTFTVGAPLPCQSHVQRKTKMYFKNSETGAYNCSACSKDLATLTSVRVHYEAFHLGRRFPCHLCKRSFNQPASLIRHKRTCKGIIANQQTIFHFKPVPVQLRNRLSQMGKETEQNGLFPCPTCGKRFSRDFVLKRHIRQVHMKERKNHSCELCGKRFLTTFSLQEHMARVHFGREEESGSATATENFKTEKDEDPILPLSDEDEMEVDFSNIKVEITYPETKAEAPQNIARSLSQQNDEDLVDANDDQHIIKMYVRNPETRLYNCAACNKELKTPRNCRVHYEAIHLGKTFVCSRCGKIFAQGSSLSRHEKDCRGKQ